MSPDEVMTMVVCSALSIIVWGGWFYRSMSLTRLPSRQRDRLIFHLTPILCAAALFAVLKMAASHDVRDDPVYLAFYMIMGSAWVGCATQLFGCVSVSVRDDVLERRNQAAGLAVMGMTIGVTLCFAGGNIGDGPGWWVVVVCGLLSTGTLAAAWFLVVDCTDVVDGLTIDRDLASGMRVCGFFIASGLVLGRAVAGDYISFDATLMDFAKTAWPVFVMTGMEIGLEKLWRPTWGHPTRSFYGEGVLPAVAYMAMAMAWVCERGSWQ